MDKHTDFFGDVFESPEDDPLLGGEEERSAEGSQSEADQGPPAWVQEADAQGRLPDASQDASSDPDCGAGPERKRIVVDQEEQQGLTELNDAIGQGWRLVQISLDRPSGQQAASRSAAKRFVAVLEQERPQSLFDFGAP